MTDVIEPCIPLQTHPARQTEAGVFVKRFNLTLSAAIGKTPYRLYFGPERLELQSLEENAPKPVFVDFTGGKAEYRRNSTGKQQPLPRAIGLKSGERPTVVDATAGLGRDALVLAALGCRVILVERSPVFAALLADGLARASLNEALAGIIERMELVHADSRTWLSQLNSAFTPDVIYLDPMYPHREKSALVKKEMRFARAVVGDDQDASELLVMGLRIAAQRVVVKRPRIAPPLEGPPPTVSINGKTTRYDIYVCKLFSGAL